MTYDQVVAHFGSLSNAARALGLLKTTVHKWQYIGIGPTRQAWIELKTSGALKADLSAPEQEPA